MIFTNLTKQAKFFAHRAHDAIGQKRKYSGEPYWVHVDEVAAIVAEHGGSELAIAAAFLHDTVEDTGVKLNEIMLRFGIPVGRLVEELTDVYVHEAYPKLKRDERKARERDRLSKISDEAKLIKVIDLISNTKSIVEHDPEFAVTYLKEKALLLPLIATRSNRKLLDIALRQVDDGFKKLGI